MSLHNVTPGAKAPDQFNVIIEIPMNADPVDVLVVTPFPLTPGVVVTCRPIGVLKMEDEAGGDSKLLAVPIDKILPIYTHWQKPADINQMRLKAIQHFFEHYKDLEPNKWVKIGGWEGPEAARAEIINGVASYACLLYTSPSPRDS